MNGKNFVFVAMAALFLSSFATIFVQPYFGYSAGTKEVASYYLENTMTEIGSTNVVSAIVWDFRGFDTFGEETVLFTSLVGILTVLSGRLRG